MADFERDENDSANDMKLSARMRVEMFIVDIIVEAHSFIFSVSVSNCQCLLISKFSHRTSKSRAFEFGFLNIVSQSQSPTLPPHSQHTNLPVIKLGVYVKDLCSFF